MKHFFTLILICIAGAAAAQFSAGLHGGASNKHTVAGLNMQYQFANRFTAGLNLTAHANNTDPVFFQSRFGYSIGSHKAGGISIQPYTGYNYSVENFEQKNYGGHFTFGAQLKWQIGEMALLYADWNRPQKGYKVISFGLAGRIPKDCD